MVTDRPGSVVLTTWPVAVVQFPESMGQGDQSAPTERQKTQLYGQRYIEQFPAGGEVAIHVDRELTIDRDPNGRRLKHDTTPPFSAVRPLD